jgi:hypothetical protein
VDAVSHEGARLAVVRGSTRVELEGLAPPRDPSPPVWANR